MTGLTATLKTKRRFSLNWPYLGAITSGDSAIDLGSLALRNLDDARQFAREYGFDVDDPRALERIRRAHAEAVQFIVSMFLDDDYALIPAEIARPDDVLELLVHASRHARQADLLRMWSCAVLKVMHGVFYIDNDLELRHFSTIRRQVFDSIDEIVRSDGSRHVLTDGEICLPLVDFEKKSNKGRRSILLKLLQKAHYVAADISDHLGVRMTFETRFECLLALQVLQRVHLVSATNIESHRTRNTLLDLSAAKQVFVKYRALLARAGSYPLELLRQIDREMIALARPATASENPHSASSYQSLQITIRKMIHLPQSALADGGCVGADDGPGGGPGGGFGGDAAGGGGSFFFSYEIQLLDRASRAEALSGTASHEAYKQRQVQSACLRVLGRELLERVRQQQARRAGRGVATRLTVA
jgi:uncharacterized protein (TIGR04562 family)